MKRLLLVAGVLFLTVAAAGVSSAQGDPRIGTWKLDAAKSNGTNPRQSETRTYESSGDSTTMHTDIVNTDGTKQSYGYTAKPDGKAYPYTGQPPGGAETITFTNRTSNSNTAASKKGGKTLFTTTNAVSKDGKTMTVTSKGTDANGKPINSVRIYDKQ